jgi:outer membrane protein OmpA-like peptidoglycan-associated protein
MEFPKLENLYFVEGTSELERYSHLDLARNAEAIRANRAWRTIVIECHASDDEPEAEQLAAERAAAVSKGLTELGVPRDRLRSQQFGSTKPAVIAKNPGQRFWNRRCEFRY